MPYSISNSHPECEGFAVVKTANNELIGCHRTQAQAEDQLAAVQLAEYGERALPDNYRPADSADVPQGRACGNCVYNEDLYCVKWQDEIQANFYCNAWEPLPSNQTRTGRALAILKILKKIQ
jgi:hypothetical protein